MPSTVNGSTKSWILVVSGVSPINKVNLVLVSGIWVFEMVGDVADVLADTRVVGTQLHRKISDKLLESPHGHFDVLEEHDAFGLECFDL